MVFRKIIGVLSGLALVSCAQIGTISGGNVDVYAPKPIEGRTSPENASTYFSGNGFEITFDEFVQLNNPQQTLVIVPSHAKLKATLQNKTLKVSWDETLKENTTYVVYMNGVVKDVTENNDSLMTYVFSTGSAIDSLSYNVSVVDAYTNQYLPDITVGLFQEDEKTKPYYFSQTNPDGVAQFQYLKRGTYFLQAFKDENKDLKIQPSESVGFRGKKVVIDSSIIDTVSLRLFRPEEKKKITSFIPAAPGALIVEGSIPFTSTTFYLNGSPVSRDQLVELTDRKIMVLTDLSSLSDVELVASGADLTDTVSVRLTEKEKKAKIVLSPQYTNGTVGPHEQLAFLINDFIQSVDTSLISLYDGVDSTKTIPFKTKLYKNQLIIDFERTSTNQLNLVIEKGAIETTHSQPSEDFKSTIKIASEKDYGTIEINARNFTSPIIVELIKDTKTQDRLILYDTKNGLFHNVTPGEYKFRVFADENKNGKWDTGNLIEQIQPENIHWYTKPTKVRANWEVEVVLSP